MVAVALRPGVEEVIVEDLEDLEAVVEVRSVSFFWTESRTNSN